MNRFLLSYSPEGDGMGAGGGTAVLTPPAGQGQGAPGTLLPTSTPPAAPGMQAAPPTAAAIVQKPFFDGWIAPDGKINKGVYDNLPDDLKPFRNTLERYETLPELLRGMGHSFHLNGQKGLLPLEANAPEGVKQTFDRRLREILKVPEKPEGYGVKRPDNVPENQWNDSYVNGALGIMHKHNASPELVKALVEYDTKQGGEKISASHAAMQKELSDGMAELETKWGSETPKQLDLASRLARSAGLDPVKDPIFRNAKVVQAFAKIAGLVSEDRLDHGQPGGGSSKSFRQEAKDVVHNAANPLHAAYHNPGNPGHQAALNRVAELNQKALQLGQVE